MENFSNSRHTEKEVHVSGRVWRLVAAAQNVDRQPIKKLTDSMKGRRLTVIEKKGAILVTDFFFLNV